MIADLTRAAWCDVRAQPRRQRRQRPIGRTFRRRYRHPARASPAAASRRPPASSAEANGGSRNTMSNGCGGRAGSAARPRRCTVASRLPSRCKRLRQMAADLRLAIHERHVRRAARQRFEPERAAAREQIQAARADDRVLQPVEQRLAHAVGRRPDRRRAAENRCAMPRQRPPMMRNRLRRAARQRFFC